MYVCINPQSTTNTNARLPVNTGLWYSYWRSVYQYGDAFFHYLTIAGQCLRSVHREVH